MSNKGSKGQATNHSREQSPQGHRKIKYRHPGCTRNQVLGIVCLRTFCAYLCVAYLPYFYTLLRTCGRVFLRAFSSMSTCVLNISSTCLYKHLDKLGNALIRALLCCHTFNCNVYRRTQKHFYVQCSFLHTHYVIVILRAF